MPVEIDTKSEAERPTCDWQPIATAPKDGTEVLLYSRRGVVRGKWDADQYATKPRPYWRDDRTHLFGVRGTRASQPTHWQPLPAPPTPLPSCSICRRDDCGGNHPCE